MAVARQRLGHRLAAAAEAVVQREAAGVDPLRPQRDGQGITTEEGPLIVGAAVHHR